MKKLEVVDEMTSTGRRRKLLYEEDQNGSDKPPSQSIGIGWKFVLMALAMLAIVGALLIAKAAGLLPIVSLVLSLAGITTK